MLCSVARHDADIVSSDNQGCLNPQDRFHSVPTSGTEHDTGRIVPARSLEGFDKNQGRATLVLASELAKAKKKLSRDFGVNRADALRVLPQKLDG